MIEWLVKVKNKILNKKKLRVILKKNNFLIAESYNQEYLAVKISGTSKYRIGGEGYIEPVQIWQAVNLHNELMDIENGIRTGKWKVTVQNRKRNYYFYKNKPLNDERSKNRTQGISFGAFSSNGHGINQKYRSQGSYSTGTLS